jgi:hypothetical protein
VKTVFESLALSHSIGISVTAEEVKTTRLMAGAALADSRTDIVTLIAGSTMSVS